VAAIAQKTQKTAKPTVNAAQLIFSITAAAAIIAEGKTVDELTLLSNAFAQLAETLTTIASVKALNDPKEDSSDNPDLLD
jgi:hypothetical protein